MSTGIPSCPSCGSGRVDYKNKAKQWECQECERRFDAPPPEEGAVDRSQLLNGKTADPKAIFFSYGHDQNKELVDLFKADLEKRGHSVWIDYKDIGAWDDWRGRITHGIQTSQLAIAFLSKHATRDPGVCRNEIAMALNRFGTVYPVLLEPVPEVSPPVTISHLQWEDLSQWRDIKDGKVNGKDWDRWYAEKLISLIALVEGRASEFQGDIQSLREVLNPQSFSADIARHIPDFTGRQWIFDAYNDWLEQTDSRLFWIKAGPGVGKTAIASMLAHTQQSAIVSAWFCQANSQERSDTRKLLCTIAFQLATRLDDYRTKLRFQLGFNASTTPDDWSDMREAVRKKNEADLFNFLLAEPLTGLIWRDHKLVVVIDALDEASQPDGSNPLVDLLATRLAHLPKWLGFAVTSRPEPAILAKLQAFKPFEMDAQDPRNLSDLQAYLSAGLKQLPAYAALGKPQQDNVQRILHERCEGMILYLQQALAILKEDPQRLQRIEDMPPGLGSLYRIAFDRLYGGDQLHTTFDQEVAPILRLLVAVPDIFPPALAQKLLGWDKETWLRNRNKLGAYLIESTSGVRLFHKTLQEWLSDEASSPYFLETEPTQRNIGQYLWERFEQRQDASKLEWPVQIQRWLPDMIETLPQGKEAVALNALGVYLMDCAAYPRAGNLLRRALVINEKALGPNHQNVAASLNNLAVCIEKTGNPADLAAARPLYERALAIRQQALGPEHPDVASSLNNLAVYLMGTGNLADLAATRLLSERALAIREQALGPEHPDVASSLNTFAGFLMGTGNPTDRAAARPLFERALAIREQALSPEHPDVAISLNNLAMYLEKTGNPNDRAAARPLFERALSIREQALGPEHPDVAQSLNTLAGYLIGTGNQADLAAARPLLARALAIREQALGLNHPDVATSLNNLAVYLKKTGNPADLAAVRPLYERALAIYEQALGPNHPAVAQSLNNLAMYLEKTGSPADLAAARPLYDRALAIRQQALGPNHPDVVTSLNNLAGYLMDTGNPTDLAAARPLYERALAIREKVLGPDALDTIETRRCLGICLRNLGQFDESRQLFDAVIQQREALLGATHEDTLWAKSGLGKLLRMQGEFSKAIAFLSELLNVAESALGTEHYVSEGVREELELARAGSVT